MIKKHKKFGRKRAFCLKENPNPNILLTIKEHTMIPKKYVDELKGIEKLVFAKLYAGSFSKKLYRLFEYKKK